MQRYSDHTFTGSVTPTVTGATKSGTKYYTDSDKISVTFEHTICRADSANGNVDNDWKTFYDKGKDDVTSSTTASNSGTSTHAKSGDENA